MIALSLAIDRHAINNIVFSGVGYTQNYVVHETSPHYPGKRFETIDAIPQDIARANQILDGLGIVDTDGDGFRNRLDGGGNLELYAGVDSAFGLAGGRAPRVGLRQDRHQARLEGRWRSLGSHSGRTSSTSGSQTSTAAPTCGHVAILLPPIAQASHRGR